MVKNVKIIKLKMKSFPRFSITSSEGEFFFFLITIFVYVFDLHSAANNIEGWLKIFISYLMCCQIWLNLPRDDCHFGCKQKLLKETFLHSWGSYFLHTSASMFSLQHVQSNTTTHTPTSDLQFCWKWFTFQTLI